MRNIDFCTKQHAKQQQQSKIFAYMRMSRCQMLHEKHQKTCCDTSKQAWKARKSSLSDDLLWISEHASHTCGNSARTEALDEADDAGLTPTHIHPVHSGTRGYSNQGIPESRQTFASKIHQSPCLVLQLALSTWE